MGCLKSGAQPCKGRGNVAGEEGDRRNCIGFGVCVKSRVMVGNGAEADRVAIVEAKGTEGKKPELVKASLLVVEPDRSIAAAADVVLAMTVAAGGRG